MATQNDVRLLVSIAHMYYGDGATQEEVSRKFNISRSQVSKMLNRALKTGLVEIIIHDENIRPYQVVEERLRKRFNLIDAICINVSDPGQLKARLGVEGARVLQRKIKPSSIVGVSAGTTLYEVASNFTVGIPMPNLTFVPLVGGMGKAHNEIQSNVLCDILARKTGGTFLDPHMPVMVDDYHSKEVFMRQRYIRDVMSVACQADIALVGIGGKPAYHEMTKAYLHQIDRIMDDDMVDVIGDICYNFINREGVAVDSEWNKRVMAINLDDIKRIPLVIGVAGGFDKVEGILAALTGGLINVLVTDVQTANQLMEAAGQSDTIS